MSKIKRAKKLRNIKVKARASTTVFTLFGAFIVPRGGEVWIGSLIRLMKPLGLSANAIRLVLSRMSKRGWLAHSKIGRRSYYTLTKKGNTEMLAGKHWALDKERKPWDKKWRLVVYTVPEIMRHVRDSIRKYLSCSGCGSLGGSLWISPYDHHEELIAFLEKINASHYVEMFEAHYTGMDSEKDLARKVWNITKLEKHYTDFVDRYSSILAEYKTRIEKKELIEPELCFAQRFRVTAEFINIALRDSMLPIELLPADWAGLRAKRIYNEFWNLLTPEVNKFVDSVLRDSNVVNKRTKRGG
jgi:phenylacetic acid degradation operon negative regulatory protein